MHHHNPSWLTVLAKAADLKHREMPTTPFNTPRGHNPDRDVVLNLSTGNPYKSPLRVGGGYDTTSVLKGVLTEEDRLASEWRAMERRGNPLHPAPYGQQQDVNTKAAQEAQPYNETLEHFLAERKSNRLAVNSYLAKSPRAAASLAGTEVFEFSTVDTRRQFVTSPGRSSSRPSSPGAASSSGKQKSRLLGKLGLPVQTSYSSATHSNLSAHLAMVGGSQIYAPHTTFQPLVAAAADRDEAAVETSTALVPVNTSSTSPQHHPTTFQNRAGANDSHYPIEPAASPIRHTTFGEPHEDAVAVDLTRHTISSQGKLRSARDKELQDARQFAERYVSQQYDAHTRDSKADGAIQMNASSFHAHDHLRHFNPSANSSSFLAAIGSDDMTGNAIIGNTLGQGQNYTVTNSSMLRVLKNSNHLVSRVVERSGVNLSCCGGGGKAPPAAGTGVNGLFVTYCQNDVHTQLENARRRLETEEGAREYDHQVAYDRIAALTADNQRQAAEIEHLKQTLEAKEARFQSDVNDLTTLKEEYGRRFREANAKMETIQSEKSADQRKIDTLQRDVSNRDDKINELNRTVRDLQTNLAATEAQLRESAKHTTMAHQDKVRAEAEATEFKKQLSYFHEKVKTKDQLLRGSETTLRFVEGKLAATHHINGRKLLQHQEQHVARRR